MSEQVLGNPHDRIDALEANLDRFVDLVMQGQRNHQVQLDGLTQNQNIMMQEIVQLNRAEANMMKAIQELPTIQKETNTRFEQMHLEILEMQAENRRILDLLFNQQQSRDDDEG